MSYYEEDPAYLSQEEVEEIQEEYRKKRLIEALVGPSISTVFHVMLVILLSIFLIDTVQPEKPDIQIIVEDIQEIEDIPMKPDDPIIEEPLETKIDPTVAVNVPNPEADINNEAIEDTSDPHNETMDERFEEMASEVELSESVFVDPSLAGSRSKSGIRGSMARFGPDIDTLPNFIKCLEWLAKVQNADGSWGNDAKGGYTSLALLTFLAFGELPSSRRYGNTVLKAMKWLQQDKIDTKSHHGYPHAIKTYALSEAYAMTGNSLLKEKMDECVRVLIKGQQDGGAYDYNYKANENRQDLSFSGWNYQALKAAYIAGCEEPGLTEAIYKALDYLKLMAESEKSFAYTTSNSDPDSAKGAGKWTMRAVGTLCLQLLEPGKHNILTDELDKMLAEGKARFNWKKAPKRSLYGWYYETNAMFHAQGKYWRNWKNHYAQVLVDNQHPEGYWMYPGNNHMPGNDLSHKVYATTLAALMITVPFRYLPSSSSVVAPKEMKEAKVKKNEKVTEEEGIDLVE